MSGVGSVSNWAAQHANINRQKLGSAASDAARRGIRFKDKEPKHYNNKPPKTADPDASKSSVAKARC